MTRSRRRAAAALALPLLTVGLTAAAGHADAARELTCEPGYLCLFAGPHGTGRVLYAADAHVTSDWFTLADAEDIEPPIFPRSVRDPLPDGFGCTVRLDDQPNLAGTGWEVGDLGVDELTGARVASLAPICG
ncbi:hypothetical protein F0L68_28930 [Solihabitans fulvus]|uniref:Peptidase inhibitor family I36 n=1 Tax=Solihabitans fulvus TaxID=1892852 RepID=A0A5B2WXN6_9PSEU|nr:hypothetical protein [Solihabitans fulvus]KAA2255246.1 hypothetical protein F0L68_28930 [Solihabitans fulvus]